MRGSSMDRGGGGGGGFQALLMNGDHLVGQSTADLFSRFNPHDENGVAIKDETMSTAVVGFVPKTHEYSLAMAMALGGPISPMIPRVYNDEYPAALLMRKQLEYSSQIEIEMLMSSSSLARHRRQKLSDKIRCLQKILPWDKKMNMATMLEEAYKYVKFLQAQVSILESMPPYTSTSSHANINSTAAAADLYGGGLGKLNRQQLLQVLVNSQVAQTLLYSRGCCVYSVEQLIAPLRDWDCREEIQNTNQFHPDHSLMN